MLNRKKSLVAGYGDVGKGAASFFWSRINSNWLNGQYVLFGCMDGYEVKRINSVVEKMDIIVTATGNKDIITGKHFEKMKDKTIVYISHFDNEIDISWLENFSHQKPK